MSVTRSVLQTRSLPNTVGALTDHLTDHLMDHLMDHLTEHLTDHLNLWQVRCTYSRNLLIQRCLFKWFVQRELMWVKFPKQKMTTGRTEDGNGARGPAQMDHGTGSAGHGPSVTRGLKVTLHQQLLLRHHVSTTGPIISERPGPNPPNQIFMQQRQS